MLISQLNYLFLTLPNPSRDFLKELNQTLFKFLWNNKPDRIKRSIACRPVSEGGLGMIDIYAYVKALKVIWMRKALDETKVHTWKSLLLSTYPEIKKVVCFGQSYLSVVIGKVKNNFWKDCLKAFNVFAQNIVPSNFEECLTEPIFYNPNITIDGKPFYNVNWHQKGITQISEFFNTNGEFLTLLEFKDNFDIDPGYLTYYGIVQAIKSYLRKQQIIQTEFSTFLDDTNVMRKLLSVKKGSKVYYYILTDKTSSIKAESKWEELLNCEICWKKIYSKPFKTTQDTKLRWFQCRLLHRIITTNIFAHKIKKAETNLCTFCKHFPETLLHLFWDCILVKTFWIFFVQYFTENCPQFFNLSLDAKVIILGESNNMATDEIFDLFLLLAKFFIYKCKVTGVLPDMKHFKHIMKFRYQIEKRIHYNKNLHKKFHEKWILYHSLFKS